MAQIYINSSNLALFQVNLAKEDSIDFLVSSLIG